MKYFFSQGKGLGKIYCGQRDRNPTQTSLSRKRNYLSALAALPGHLALCLPACPSPLLPPVVPRRPGCPVCHPDGCSWRTVGMPPAWQACGGGVALSTVSRGCSGASHSVLMARRCGALGPHGGRGSGSSEQGALVGGGRERTRSEMEGRAF